jgi:hypothetical protein
MPEHHDRLNFAADCEAVAAGAATEPEIRRRLGGRSVPEIHARAEVVRATRTREQASETALAMDRRIALGRDRGAILAVGIEGARRATAGIDRPADSPPVEITASEGHVKEINGYSWEVSGVYLDPDGLGQGGGRRSVWTARVELSADLSSAGLICRGIQWGDRRISP